MLENTAGAGIASRLKQPESVQGKSVLVLATTCEESGGPRIVGDYPTYLAFPIVFDFEVKMGHQS